MRSCTARQLQRRLVHSHNRPVRPRPHQQKCRSNVRLCCQKRQQCRTSFALKFRPFDKVERCFDTVAQNGNIVEATGNKVACCFDNVASTYDIVAIVWTGLKSVFTWNVAAITKHELLPLFCYDFVRIQHVHNTQLA